MTVTRRLRVHCDPNINITVPRKREPQGLRVRNEVENYKAGHTTFEEYEKAVIAKAQKKAKEERAKKMNFIPWFFLYAHILLIIEYLGYRAIWG